MYLELKLLGEDLWLLPEKALFWPAQKMLVVSDVHLGKAAHFRKNGIALPAQMVYDDLDVLDSLIARFAPETVLFLGDLFHSSPNQEWELFHQWLVARHQLRFVLIEGNHDQYNDNHQVMSALDARSSLLLGPFYFSHHPEESPTHVNICGHLHPGVRLEGKGRQSITLPGFWLSERQLVMPAFGNLTGKMVPKKLSCRTFAIAGGNVLEVTQRR